MDNQNQNQPQAAQAQVQPQTLPPQAPQAPPPVTPIPITSTTRKRRPASRLKSVVIWGEFFVILLLLAAILASSLYQRKKLSDAMSLMSSEQQSLADEMTRLSDSVLHMEKMQESLIRSAADETILTYDDTGAEVHIPILADVPRHNYDWTCIQNKDGFKNYVENNEVTSYRGIDVSSFQGEIDWDRVKAAGVDFAIIRVGYRGYGTGAVMLDEYFDANMRGALKAGIKVGTYFFSQAVTEEEAIEEANFVLEHIKDYDITYPIAYDMELITHDTARTDTLTGRQITDHTIAFCETIKEAGYKTCVYSNRRTLILKLDLSRLTAYDTWYAAYVSYPDYPYDFKMWQFTDSGSVDGISGDVDINISFIDYSAE